MRFNFVKFTDTSSSFAARVTIRQTGQFGFNTGALNRFQIQVYDYSVLYFDSASRVVGIELTNDPKADGAIEFKRSTSNTYIRSKNFCDKFGIDYTKSHRYELKRDDSSGILYFELDRELDSPPNGEDQDSEQEDEQIIPQEK